MDADEIPLLPAHTWDTSYRHEDGDLIHLFYVPALSCAVQYDRMTGYFSADALALAARGIERLIANGGKMRLIVGCTLDSDEVQAIGEGYDLREQVEKKLAATSLIGRVTGSLSAAASTRRLAAGSTTVRAFTCISRGWVDATSSTFRTRSNPSSGFGKGVPVA